MSQEEENTWVGMVVGVGVLIYYLSTIFVPAIGTDVSQIDYQSTLLWLVGVSIVTTIVGAIAVAIVTGDKDTRDQRDKEISRRGDFVGYFVLVFAALAAMGMAMTEGELFWIANVLFLGFLVSSMVSGAVKLVAYRRGF